MIGYQYGASIAEARTKLGYGFSYIKHLSLLPEFAILFETATAIISGRGAK